MKPLYSAWFNYYKCNECGQFMVPIDMVFFMSKKEIEADEGHYAVYGCWKCPLCGMQGDIVGIAASSEEEILIERKLRELAKKDKEAANNILSI